MWDYGVGPPRRSLSESSSDVSSTAACAGKWCLLRPDGVFLDLLSLHRPSTHRAGACKGEGPRPLVAYDIVRRMASLLSLGWAASCRIASVGCPLTRFTPSWTSERSG